MPEPMGRDAALELAGPALDGAGGADVEVLVIHGWGGLTRFAGSAIHQSTAQEETAVRVRAVKDGRVGVSSTNDLRPAGVQAAARSALEMVELAAPDPLFPGLAPRAEAPTIDGYDPATSETSPAARAEAVEALVGACGPGFTAAGAFETGALEVAVANTEGLTVHATRSKASITAVVSGGEGGAGFAERAAGRVADLDAAAVGAAAFAKARDSQRPRDLQPGDYEVVLEPAAVATLLAFLSYLGFGGRAIAEGRSCFAGREGQRLMSEQVSIWDDALSPDTIGLPFDFEGTPKQRVDLVREGIFVGGVHDRRSGAQTGGESTGHALPPPNPEGPFPLNLFMATGNASTDDMIAATRRGLLVSRFHYANVVHPKEAVITGMTRDGTWLIEDGAIVGPVKNLRFTESIIDALDRVDLVGSESTLASEFFFEASRVPALRIGSFRFTGTSDH
ncbi:MAG TPA: metallopeptidase TldD-related protein [Actinomycetota bacterium]